MAILKIAKFLCAFQFSVHVVACVFAFCSAAIMASLLVGAIGEFDTCTDTFKAYHKRLEQYVVANSIGHYPSDASAAVIAAANKKKVAVMISVIGKKTYGTLRDLCSPENPKDKTFKQSCELLERHFKPKEENETVSVYSDRLRHLASSCNFGEFLNRSLRDQFVCGIRNPATRKKLLSEDRTFQQAMQVAIADEITAKESMQVQQQLSQPVNAVAKDPPALSSRRSSNTPPALPPAGRQGSFPKSPRWLAPPPGWLSW